MDLLSWARRRHTPLWLELNVKPGRAFRALELEQPPRVLVGDKGRPYFPLVLPLGVERDDVIEALWAQIEGLLDLATGSGVSVIAPTSEEPPADGDGEVLAP